ncbi:MAG: hypothetical protein ACKOOH_00450, partial [Cyanobium sp.]
MTIRPLQARWRGVKVAMFTCALPLFSWLSGCAGTPWGDKLSGSFPTPPAQATPEQASPQEPQPTQPPLGSLSKDGALPQPDSSPSRQLKSKTSPTKGTPGGQPPGEQSPKMAAPQPKAPTVASAPSPYRVTLRLPVADPSAPAEAVTQALRTAGISFEVETIERVKGVSSQPAEAPPPPPASI